MDRSHRFATQNEVSNLDLSTVVCASKHTPLLLLKRQHDYSCCQSASRFIRHLLSDHLYLLHQPSIYHNHNLMLGGGNLSISPSASAPLSQNQCILGYCWTPVTARQQLALWFSSTQWHSAAASHPRCVCVCAEMVSAQWPPCVTLCICVCPDKPHCLARRRGALFSALTARYRCPTHLAPQKPNAHICWGTDGLN